MVSCRRRYDRSFPSSREVGDAGDTIITLAFQAGVLFAPTVVPYGDDSGAVVVVFAVVVVTATTAARDITIL